jgi:hypothetical protein
VQRLDPADAGFTVMAPVGAGDLAFVTGPAGLVITAPMPRLLEWAESACKAGRSCGGITLPSLSSALSAPSLVSGWPLAAQSRRATRVATASSASNISGGNVAPASSW